MIVTKELALALAMLSMWGLSHAESNITSDTYFYGQSEPVYPSPQGSGSGGWAAAYEKAAAMVSQMTLEEKNNLTYGISSAKNGCSGNIPPIARLGFTGLCLTDAGNGVRATDFVNSYPSGIHIGASWNKTLAYERGWHMGGEFRKKGVHVALGPVVGPLGRVISGGRNWEGPSNDPYLGGAIAAATVKGTQEQGVITSVKHFIANEQELYRNPTLDSEKRTVESISSNLDDKTMHELYLWPFQDALKAGAGNIMCSYNRINNSYACQNSKTLNGLLKTELGFQGFVVSDWNAQHAGVGAALAGLDMAMPDGQTFWGNNFTEAFTNGSVPMTRLDDMATRIIATWYQMGQDTKFPALGVGMPANMSEPHSFVNALTPDAKPVLFEGAVEGHVLVKNVNNTLPLKSPQLISVFGYDAKAPDASMPSGKFFIENPWMLGLQPAVFQSGEVFVNTSPNIPDDFQVAFNGTLSVGGGSGANNGPYLSAPLDALQQRAYEDNTVLFWDSAVSSRNRGLMEASNACLVFINAFATESMDRPGVREDYSDGLVEQVASTCANTIVIIHNAGTRLVDRFADHQNVTAIVFAHLPGQESGRAIVSLLYGDENFSGKLPYTVAKNESDYATLVHDGAVAPYGLFPQSDFDEGILTDYRYFDKHNITPRYEFGFGLSYTTFSFKNIQVSAPQIKLAAYATGTIEQGGAVDLWDNVVTVTVEVSNTGRRSGAEVAQLYVAIPGGPPKQLRGFEKVTIAPGQTVQVAFSLTRRDLSTWDVVAQKWKLQSGIYTIFAGSSSRDLPLSTNLKLNSA
ncbi:putative beta-glucosidase [Penicillium oxalicum 114-2]|uniref:Probable beta-glucosidase M n=1 Tax=Penicillium oxalicum (strain 114-2 / CGMCC 5302) TaxID=933388 RepID=S7ZBJ9_PENO1|nr:putative beta-glucosidase [Penicillium oxalicum 114-2]